MMGRRKNGTNHGARTPLTAHPLFAPVLGLWGAALGGLTTLVLPSDLFTTALAGTGMAALGTQAQFVLAGMAAVLLGGALFILAVALSGKTRRTTASMSVAEMALRRVRPIDPMRELGSHSLDEPVAQTPFAAAPFSPNPFADDPAPEPEDAAPRALDLSEFAELPGRNAVWVEDGVASPVAVPRSAAPLSAPPTAPLSVPQSVPRPFVVPEPGTAALAHLRATPPEQLSLVQMVERFAAALHEQRRAAPGSAGHNRDLAARDAALAEALKALAALSGDQPARDAQAEPLRDALSRLQGLRGAA
jgi:hypothetical protein